MRKLPSGKSLARRPGVWCALGAITLCSGKMTAVQPVIYTGPVVPVSPELLRDQRVQTLTNSPAVFIPASEAVRSDLPDAFRSGPFNFRPHVEYQFLYGSGIQSTPAVRGTTAIHTLSPGFTVEYGAHWILDYTPTFTMYSNDKFHDTVGHAVSLVGATEYNDWRFRLQQGFSSSEQVLAETGGETFQQSFNTTISGSRALNDKLSLDVDFNQKLLDTEDLQNTRDWSLDSMLNYQFWDRFSAGAGVTVGFVDVDFGPGQTYQDATAKIDWRISDKVGLSANAGGEAREFEGGDTLFTPVYGVTLQYQPRLRTQLSAGISRSVTPSVFAGQVTDSTTFNVSITQQLFKKFSLSLWGNYNFVDYTNPGGQSNRRDDIIGYGARLSHPMFKRGTLSVIYQFGDNNSTDQKFSYRTDQVGAQFNYAF